MIENKQPIIIQGAMEMEVEELLKEVNVEKIIKDFKFYIGQINECLEIKLKWKLLTKDYLF